MVQSGLAPGPTLPKGNPMTYRQATLSILLTGLLAAGSAQAQTSSPGGNAVDVPSAGEASTQLHGQPNMIAPPPGEQLWVTGMVGAAPRIVAIENAGAAFT